MADDDLVGQRFVKWTVLTKLKRRTKSGGVYYECMCDCGRVREVTGSSLRTWKTSGCNNCGKVKKPVCKRGHTVALNGRTPSKSCRLCVKEKSLIRNYGITYAEFLKLYEMQGGKCAICDKEMALTIEKQGFHRSGRVEVDHRHGQPGPVRHSVRGLLCGGRWAGCNRRLGRIDNPDWLRRVIDYLEHPPAKRLTAAYPDSPPGSPIVKERKKKYR